MLMQEMRPVLNLLPVGLAAELQVSNPSFTLLRNHCGISQLVVHMLPARKSFAHGRPDEE